MNPNAVTLAAYQQNWQQYLAGTPPVPLDEHGPWLPQALALRPPGSTVLEIGSGPGHDAAAMEATGIPVERTDATEAFVEHLRAQGHQTRQLDILTGEPRGVLNLTYGMIYAFAVFQHFTPAQLHIALRKCAAALTPGGILAFSLRRGAGAGWRVRKDIPPRFFCFWEPGPLWEAVEQAGLRMLSLHQDGKANRDADLEMKNWLLITATPGES